MIIGIVWSVRFQRDYENSTIGVWTSPFFFSTKEKAERKTNVRQPVLLPSFFFQRRQRQNERRASFQRVLPGFFSLLDWNIESIADAGPLPELNGELVTMFQVLRIKNMTRYSKRGLKRNQECAKYRDQTKILSLRLSYNTIQLEQPPPRNDFYSYRLNKKSIIEIISFNAIFYCDVVINMDAALRQWDATTTVLRKSVACGLHG